MKSPVYTKKNIELIKAMQDSGSTSKEIARAIGSTPGSVMARVSQLGLSRNPKVTFGATRVHFPTHVITRCVPHAARRGLSTSELLRLLIERIAQDNLFEAILDDGK